MPADYEEILKNVQERDYIDSHREESPLRQADDALPETTFAHLPEGSSFIDKGIAIDATNYRGINVAGISYEGQAPDLGAYESNYHSTAVKLVKQSSQGTLRFCQTASGLVILTLDTARTTDTYQASFFDATGRLLGQHTFQGNSTALRLPYSTTIVRVKGNNYNATAKVVCRR